MVLVLKFNGQLQVCIDFRKVNKDIMNDAYPIHWINKNLKVMAGAPVFTTIDLNKVYYQLIQTTNQSLSRRYPRLRAYFSEMSSHLG